MRVILLGHVCLRSRWASAASSVGEAINFVSLLLPLPPIPALVLTGKLMKPRAMAARARGRKPVVRLSSSRKCPAQRG